MLHSSLLLRRLPAVIPTSGNRLQVKKLNVLGSVLYKRHTRMMKEYPPAGLPTANENYTARVTLSPDKEVHGGTKSHRR